MLFFFLFVILFCFILIFKGFQLFNNHVLPLSAQRMLVDESDKMVLVTRKSRGKKSFFVRMERWFWIQSSKVFGFAYVIPNVRPREDVVHWMIERLLRKAVRHCTWKKFDHTKVGALTFNVEQEPMVVAEMMKQDIQLTIGL